VSGRERWGEVGRWWRWRRMEDFCYSGVEVMSVVDVCVQRECRWCDED
jgi:hypothetical protein